MLMGPRPAEGIPLYDLDPRCHVCGQVHHARREVDHPERGRLLACPDCASARSEDVVPFPSLAWWRRQR